MEPDETAATQPTPGDVKPTPAQEPEAKPSGPDTAAEMAALRARLSELEAAETARRDQTAAAETDRLVKAGRADDVRKYFEGVVTAKDKLIAEKDRQLAEKDRQYRDTERMRAITAALAGHELSYPQAAEHLLRLMADDFETTTDGKGRFVVREKASLRPVDQVIAERMASPTYQTFLAPSGRGGGGARPSKSTDTGGKPAEYKTLGEYIAAKWNSREKPLGKDFGLFGK